MLCNASRPDDEQSFTELTQLSHGNRRHSSARYKSYNSCNDAIQWPQSSRNEHGLSKLMHQCRDTVTYLWSQLSKYFWRLLLFLGLLIIAVAIVKCLILSNDGTQTVLTSTLPKSRFNHNPTVSSPLQPHIVWIVADDIGYSDLSYNGAEYPTTHIDLAASQGLTLTQHYVQPMSIATRASFLTGRYAFRMGLQSQENIAQPGTTAHLPKDVPTIAERLQNYGYSTHAFGKWNLGYSQRDYWPTARGFDTHLGFYQSQIDYFSRQSCVDDLCGYDWWKNGKIDTSTIDQYSTDILLDEIGSQLYKYEKSKKSNPLFLYIALQNPHLPLEIGNDYSDDSDACASIRDDTRKGFCQSMQILDESFGEIVSLLKLYQIWDDTLLIFTSDNGAQAPQSCGDGSSAGSNYPYRGSKHTLFEGGVLTPSFISGPQLPSHIRGGQTSQLFHAVDWMPTLLHYANGETAKFDDASIDGFDLWDSIIYDSEAHSRTNVPINIDKNSDGSDDDASQLIRFAIRNDKYKLIQNQKLIINSQNCDIYSPKPGLKHFQSSIAQSHDDNTGDSDSNLMLFDVISDPFEGTDLLDGDSWDSANYDTYKDIIAELLTLGLSYVGSDNDNSFVELQSSDKKGTVINGVWDAFES